MNQGSNSELVKYIWANLHNGYSLTSIRNQLKLQGIPLQEINKAFDYIYANYYYSKNKNDYRNYSNQRMKSSKSPPPHESQVIFAFIVIIGVLIIGFSAVFILWGNSPVEHISTDSGASLTEDKEESSIYDEPKNQDNEDKINFEEETDDEDNTNQETNEISFEKKETSEDTQKENMDTIQGRIKSTNAYNNRQIREQVDYYSQKDPKKAIKYCEEYDIKEKQEFCYKDVAFKSGNSDYCRKISITNIKDDCYLEYVIDGSTQENYCEQVTQESKKKNCFKLIDLNKELNSVESLSDVNPADYEKTEINESDYSIKADFY